MIPANSAAFQEPFATWLSLSMNLNLGNISTATDIICQYTSVIHFWAIQATGRQERAQVYMMVIL
ncbi:hypothetical protein DBY73_013325 [Enterobacter sp. RIT418]|nr:hypothetical protein DBY73_013325 [Enterobacter sp. RIT 418]